MLQLPHYGGKLSVYLVVFSLVHMYSKAFLPFLRKEYCNDITDTTNQYFVDDGNDGVRRAKMGMNSLPRRQPPLLKGGLSRREKRLSTVFAWQFGDAFALSGRLIAGINEVP